ncbi:MAG: hypothetical protein J6S76_00725 [Clostridia bacterium]|nr:hypothetical protein [Clostridia bacterium]
MTTAAGRRRRAALCLLLALTLLLSLLCTGCRTNAITMTPSAFREALTALCSDDFGAITETEVVDAATSICKISDRLTLTLYADPVTGLLARAELSIALDVDITDLDYASFSYFFLIMLKAYDPNISISSINTVHDALEIGTYVQGTSTSIGFGSSTYSYSVTESEARFSALYIVPAETLDL